MDRISMAEVAKALGEEPPPGGRAGPGCLVDGARAGAVVFAVLHALAAPVLVMAAGEVSPAWAVLMIEGALFWTCVAAVICLLGGRPDDRPSP